MPDLSPENKNKAVFSAAVPALIVMWLVLVFFGNYMAPSQFRFLPQKIRELHIISLFFRSDSWHFPLSLTQNISPPIGYSLALSDSIPLIALIFKICGFNNAQYFGGWFLLSFLLTAAFAYRITRKIFKDKFLQTGLGTVIFVFMPFAWYHPYWVPWTAGQWTTLWALSLFFQKRRHLSAEWYGVLIFSALIHPFFVLVNLFLGIADISRLYLYKHRISVIQAAVFFGNILSVAVIAMACIGTFFTQTFADPEVLPTPLTLRYFFLSQAPLEYSSAYLYPGLGILLGLIPTPFIAIFNPAAKYIKRYRPLIFCFVVFFIFSIGGGILIGAKLLRLSFGAWADEGVLSILSSGPRFFTSVLWVLPILLLQNAAWMEKIGWRKVSLLMLSACVLIQISQFRPIFPESEPEFVELEQKYRDFMADRSEIIWIQGEGDYKQIPYFEQIAYFAWSKNKRISSAPSVRIVSGYKISARANRSAFIKKEFNPDCIYILTPQSLTADLNRYGHIMRMNKVFLFKPKLSAPKDG